MGMVQSKKENSLVYKVGCLGKISDYQETSDSNVNYNISKCVTRSLNNGTCKITTSALPGLLGKPKKLPSTNSSATNLGRPLWY